MTKRQRIYSKFNGLCAYSGTPLEDDWQIDHVEPIRRNWWDGTCEHPERETEDNLVPCQRAINKYKSSNPLETFRNFQLGRMHERMKKLPKNPKSEEGIKRKESMLRIAGYFGITPDNPFKGTFYFEEYDNRQENIRGQV